jgi:peptidoglycan/LPS O-acetylase OafA/YrhL
MCFSANASLTAGTLLIGVGVMTTRMASTPGERAYASIPLLFALQQLTEGVIWLSFGWGRPSVTAAATQLYSFFSHVLWPVYIPIAAWLLEPDTRRRQLLAAVCAAGVAVGAYLLYSMFVYPIVATPVGGHIDYASPHFYIAASMGLYLLATSVSLMLSSQRWVRLFGALALASAIAAYAFYAHWFISVWCFFAALLSVTVALHLLAQRTSAIRELAPWTRA